MSIRDYVKAHLDGWFNLSTGLGTIRDKSVHTRHEADCILSFQECTALFHHDSICGIGALAYPEDALRRGWMVEGQDAEALELELHQLEVGTKVEDGATWGRAYGGAIGVLWIDDGRDCTQPVDRSKGYNILSIDIYDRRLVNRYAFVTNRGSVQYSKARLFQVTPAYGGETFIVHRDRLILFGGAKTADLERETNAGWDYSIYQAALRYIRGFNNGFSAVENMLQDASQGVLTIKGVVGRATTPGGREELAARAEMFDLFRSVARSIILDSDGRETYTKVPTQFAQVPETLDAFVSLVSAVWGIPVTRLMGTSPGGLNATGESDLRNYYDNVEKWRKTGIIPQIDYLLDIMRPGRGNKIKLPPLYQPTEKEAAETDKVRAEADSLRIEDQVISADEVRATPRRIGGVQINPLNKPKLPALVAPARPPKTPAANAPQLPPPAPK